MTLGKVRRVFGVGVVILVVGSFAGLPAKAQDDLTSKVSFLILRDSSGKPIRAASVVLHPVTSKGKQKRGGFELKTDNDGKTQFEGVPYGKMRIQVLAPGFQTYGEDYDINQPEVTITVKLKRPVEQYSVYGDSSNSPKKDAPKDAKPQ